MFPTGYPLSSDCIEESFELLKGDLHPEETGLKILENSFREQQTNLEVANLTFPIPLHYTSSLCQIFSVYGSFYPDLVDYVFHRCIGDDQAVSVTQFYCSS